MIKSLNTAASGMQAQQTNMDVISNNIANTSTTGFKRARAEFEDLMYQTVKEPGAMSGLNAVSPTGVQVGHGVRTASVQKDFDIGSAKITRNPLDVQIEGQGFFQVLLSDGQIGYSRNGAFKKDVNGRLVDQNGHLLQPEITLPPNTSGVSIGPTGEVAVVIGTSNIPQTVGQIQLASFVNPPGLKSLGKNIYIPSAASGAAQVGNPGESIFGALAQGQLEMSNVNIVDEMVNMISAQRAYETNSKVIQAADQMLQYVNSLR